MSDLDEWQRYIFCRLMTRASIDHETECWNWQGSAGNSGYGKLRIGHSKDHQTHRLSYQLFHGEIPDGLCVLHRCDNRKCINPEHLFVGTHADNTRDMIEKGRHIPSMSLRTHCPRGHEYDGINSNGARICKVCDKETRRRYVERRQLCQRPS
jgi:hypothetical protein